MNRVSRSALQTRVLLVAAAAFLTVATGCPKKEDGAKPGDAPAAAAAAGGAVATVNGTSIERAAFDKQMERTRARFQRAGRQVAPALETRLKENLIRKLVEETLIAHKAKAEGVTLEATELDAKVAEHKARFGSDKAFQSFLERTQQSEADVKSDLEKTLLRDKLFAKLMTGQEPTEADAQKYFEENKEKYKQKEQINAQHILFKVEKETPDAEKKKKLETAKKVLKDAQKGGDFAELAKKHSEGPTAQKGGDLGTFSRGRMVKQFEDAAFAAKAGSIIGPVETQFGYHIIKVNEKIPEAQRTYDEVKESILTSLKARQKSRASRELLDKLRAEAKIEVLEPGVSLDPKKPVPANVDGAPATPGAMEAINGQAKAAEAGAGGEKAGEPAADGAAAAPASP